MAVARITWQATPRNKISVNHSEQYDVGNFGGGGGVPAGGGVGAAVRTPEAEGIRLYTPGHIQQVSWSSPWTNRLLFEAGWGNYLSRYANFAPRRDGSHTRHGLGGRGGGVAADGSLPCRGGHGRAEVP